MRPRKSSTEQVLIRSAQCFKSYGYTACSMGKLAEACDVSKAAFYYDYPSKDALLMDILNMTHLHLNEQIFNALTQKTAQPQQQFTMAHQRAVEFFSYGEMGCLVGILSTERHLLSTDLVTKLQLIFHDWQNAFEAFFKFYLDEATAQKLAKISLADYEGAILMARLKQDSSYLDLVLERILAQLAVS